MKKTLAQAGEDSSEPLSTVCNVSSDSAPMPGAGDRYGDHMSGVLIGQTASVGFFIQSKSYIRLLPGKYQDGGQVVATIAIAFSILPSAL